MKNILLVSALLFLVSSSLHAENITLTTYYPAPSGNYKSMQSQTMMLRPSTRAEIDADNPCTRRGAPMSECAGLMYYDKDDFAVYFFNGTDWSALGQEQPSGLRIGGYEKALLETTAAQDITTAYLYMDDVQAPVIVDESNASDGVNSKYGRYTRLQLMAASSTHPTAALGVNFRNLPKSIYDFTWGADIDVDQYIVFTKLKRTSSPAAVISSSDPIYNDLIDYAKQIANVTPLKVSANLQIYTSDGWRNLDASEAFYDTVENREPGNDWAEPAAYTSESLSRTLSLTYAASSSKKDVWRRYRIIITKQGLHDKTVSFKDPDNPSQKYTATYNVPLKLRLRNLTLKAKIQ